MLNPTKSRQSQRNARCSAGSRRPPASKVFGCAHRLWATLRCLLYDGPNVLRWPKCEQIAQQVSDFGAKEIYKQQAQKWRAMAAQAERIKSEEQEA
jgi:hypothetical protein